MFLKGNVHVNTIENKVKKKGKGTVPAADAAKAYREGKRYSCTHF